MSQERDHRLLSAPWINKAWPLAAYLGLSVLFYGRGPLGDLTGSTLSHTHSDAAFFLWSLRWWPHAVRTASDPFFSNLVYAPEGINLAWTTFIPLPSLVTWPITETLGPIVSFNLLTIFSPALAAWATFLLCRSLTGSTAPSFAGGAIFGFSTYQSVELFAGHLNLSLVFCIPLAVWIVTRYVRGRAQAPATVALLTAALVGQFLTSTEVFGTMALFGGGAGLVAWFLAPIEMRPRILRAAGLVALSYLLATVVVAPYVRAYLVYPEPERLGHQIGANLFREVRPLQDALAFVVPQKITALGSSLAPRGTSSWYFGAPLVLVLGHAFLERRRDRRAWGVAIVFVTSAILSYGAHLRVLDHTLPLPWVLMRGLPLSRALPSRLIVYAWLAAAVGVSIWIATRPASRLRWISLGLAGLFLLPRFDLAVWKVTATPAIGPGPVRTGDTVVVIHEERGYQMILQAENRFRFGLAGGFLGVNPPGYPVFRLHRRLAVGGIRPDDGPRLRQFLRETGVDVLLVANDQAPSVTELLERLLGVHATHAAGFGVLRVPANV